MKVGDLVTLSATACRMQSLYTWSARYREHYKKKPLVGMIIGIARSNLFHERHKKVYQVRWLDAHGPSDRYGQWGSANEGFWRLDLKFISKA